MKKVLKFRFLMILVFILGTVSCVKTDDFGLPKGENPDFVFQGNSTSISAVKAHFNSETGEIYTFSETVAMEAFVISSDEGGNFYKKLVVQDKASNPNAGIQILIDDPSLFSTYNFGRKIYVRLNGLSLGYNNGSLQLGLQNRGDIIPIPQALLDEHIIRTPETATIEPLKLDIRDFNESYKNLFIQLDNVQFNRNLVQEEQVMTFASEDFDEYDGVRQLESCVTGATTMLSTSTFADFRSLFLPQGSGSLKGVLTRDFYDDFFIVVLNTPEDVEFNGGERCDPEFFQCGENETPGPEIVFHEDFETITTIRMLETRGWTNINVTGGSILYKPGTLGGNRHVRITAYNTQEAPVEAWLVTPPIDLDATSGEVLSFELRSSFDNGTILRVYVTSNFTGNPLTTSWNLLEADIPIGPSNQAATIFKKTFLDLSCLEGKINIGFRYMGGVPDKVTTYDIDNVRVTGY